MKCNARLVRKMTAVIKTTQSVLILHDIDAAICELIKRCVETVDKELDVNPEIIVSFNRSKILKIIFAGYTDSVENLRFPTVFHPNPDRCLNTYNRLRDMVKNAINIVVLDFIRTLLKDTITVQH